MSTIKTKRLTIVQFNKKHLTERYVGWLNDAETIRFSRHRMRKHTIDSCRKYYLSFNNTPNFFWAIEIPDRNPPHIGNINAYVDTVNSLADIGILIGEKSVSGKGYASESWVAVCNYLFQVKNIRKITANTLSVNEPMLNLIRRVKMVEDGKRVRQILFNGKEVDIIHSAYFHEDWDKIYPGLLR